MAKKYLVCWLPFNILRVVTCVVSFADLRLLRTGLNFSWWAKSTLMILFDRIAPSIFTCALAASCPMNKVSKRQVLRVEWQGEARIEMHENKRRVSNTFLIAKNRPMGHARIKDNSTHHTVIEHDESIPLGLASRPRVVRELNVRYLTKPLEGLMKVNPRANCQLISYRIKISLTQRLPKEDSQHKFCRNERDAR